MNITINWIVELRILADVVGAMVLGGLIGLEREIAHKPAGFRTHMLVGGSSAFLVGMGDILLRHYDTASALSLSSDPIRIIQAIIVGVSFLGAGTIIRRNSRKQVEGLTTAASLLFSSTVGIAVALHQIVVATCLTVVVILILRGLGIIEKRTTRKS